MKNDKKKRLQKLIKTEFSHYAVYSGHENKTYFLFWRKGKTPQFHNREVCYDTPTTEKLDLLGLIQVQL